MDDNAGSSSSQWRLLPTAAQLHVLSHLPHNDCALSGRLTCKEAAEEFSSAEARTANLSYPLPPHAVPWAVEAGQQHVRQLPFCRKLQLMCTAAASGSEVNLEVALALLQPSIFPELLQDLEGPYRRLELDADPGAAAVKAGHPQQLGWLLHHCPGLLSPEHAMASAASHCDLAGLQAVWGLLQDGDVHRSNNRSPHVPSLGQMVLDAAAGSATADAVAKVQWLLDTVRASSCRLTEETAAAAVRSGDLGRLRWLQEQGCPMGNCCVLLSALEHAPLPVAQWLVDEAGCRVLPGAEGTGWEQLLPAAGRNPADGVGKLRWLQERGAPPLEVAGCSLGQRVASEAAQAGRVEVVRYLLPAVLRTRPDLVPVIGAISISIPLVECLQEAGLVLTESERPYQGAAKAGSIAMVRWLAQQQQEGEVPNTAAAMRDAVDLIQGWPTATSADSRSLMEAVRVVLGRAEDREAAQVLLGSVADRGPEGPALPFNEDDDFTWNIPALLRTIDAMRAVSLATRRSDAALVRYLMAKLSPTPRPLDDTRLETVVAAGCEAMLEWLAEYKPDFRERPSPGCMYLDAARNGDRGTLSTLRRLGVPWGGLDRLAEAVRGGCREPALRWLVEQGLPVGGAEELEAAVQAAVREQGLGDEAAAWLRGLAGGGAAAASGGWPLSAAAGWLTWLRGLVGAH